MYTLHLDSQDLETVSFVGYRYSWSDKLSRVGYFGSLQGDDSVIYTFPEYIAWEIRDAFEADTEGGHSFFPMLDGRSGLAQKLYRFMESIV